MMQYIVLCILLLGLPLFLFVREILHAVRSRRCTEVVEGTVVRLEEHWFLDNRSRSTFRPVVAYTYNGLRWESTTFYKFTYDTYAVNMPVMVWVDPADPEHILLAREKEKAVPSIIVTAVLLLVMAGLIAYANAEMIDQRRRQDAANAAIAEMQAELAAGNEEAFEEFIDENIVRVVNGEEITIH